MRTDGEMDFTEQTVYGGVPWPAGEPHPSAPAAQTCTCLCIDPGDWQTPAEWEQADDCPVHPLAVPREMCPHGCGCRKGTDDADVRDCACDGPCCMAEDWGPGPEPAPVAQEPPARWVKPAMRPPTDAEVAECTECDSDGSHPEVDMRKPVGGKCWFGCEKPINPPPDPMWCADPAPGSAQEPADPPLDLEALAAKWLEPCGYCDGGLPMTCTHPADDYRVPMLALVLEVERLRGQS